MQVYRIVKLIVVLADMVSSLKIQNVPNRIYGEKCSDLVAILLFRSKRPVKRIAYQQHLPRVKRLGSIVRLYELLAV